MASLVVVVLLLVSAGLVGNKLLNNEQEYTNKRVIEPCQVCDDVEPFDYEEILASERLQRQLENKKAVHERRERERIAQVEADRKKRLEKERLARLEEKKKEQAKTQVASRGSSYAPSFEITHYTAFCPTGCTGVTASGYDVSNTVYYQGYRIVAAPKTLAFYTKLRIHYEDGTVIDAIVLDRGGDIGIGRLDLLVKSREEAYELGRQQVKVEIIK
ncbi:hypothetical protein ABE073_05020 [Lederbergia citrisecunda]|uniref:3D domain-containing protein n=1 Tax=Lederbergia citrisecunda TaxID=2833583 RepID=UPI003D2DEF3F